VSTIAPIEAGPDLELHRRVKKPLKSIKASIEALDRGQEKEWTGAVFAAIGIG
jgi:hypothetical protein